MHTPRFSLPFLLVATAMVSCKPPDDLPTAPIGAASNTGLAISGANGGGPGKVVDFDFSRQHFIKYYIPAQYIPTNILEKNTEVLVPFSVVYGSNGFPTSIRILNNKLIYSNSSSPNFSKPVEDSKAFEIAATKYLTTRSIPPETNSENPRFANIYVIFRLP